jgi:hypothetical protein
MCDDEQMPISLDPRYMDAGVAQCYRSLQNELDPINYLGELPLELSLHVFKWLDVRDLCRCAQV